MTTCEDGGSVAYRYWGRCVMAIGRSTDTCFNRVLTLTAMTGSLLAIVVAVILISQQAVSRRDIAILIGFWLFPGIGLTVGYHRMLTHRSFEAHPAVRFALLALGTTAGLADPIRWAAIHVKHHTRSDAAGDPHSPLDGFFHAHLGWIYHGLDAHPEIYTPHLVNDDMVRFFEKTFWHWALGVGFLLPLLLGGWTGLLWGGPVRWTLSVHLAWSINSICHTFGRRPYETGDRSTNQWLLALLALGEGWHNNHHAFPRSAFHGLRWWQIDLSGYVIVALEGLGLVWRVHRVSPEVQQARLRKQLAQPKDEDGKALVANTSRPLGRKML